MRTMENFLADYEKLKPKQKILAEITYYGFLGTHTKNKSGIRISKTRGSTMEGEKVIKYEIEVPVND